MSAIPATVSSNRSSSAASCPPSWSVSWSEHPLQVSTIGALFAVFALPLAEAHKASYRDFFGTPGYFRERDLAIHRAFDRCAGDPNGMALTPEATAALRQRLIEEAQMYPNFKTRDVRILEESLPDAFNVRGRWASERLVM